jgi:hypothetical protein
MDTPSTQVYRLEGAVTVALRAFSENDAHEALREVLLGIEGLGGTVIQCTVKTLESD